LNERDWAQLLARGEVLLHTEPERVAELHAAVRTRARAEGFSIRTLDGADADVPVLGAVFVFLAALEERSCPACGDGRLGPLALVRGLHDETPPVLRRAMPMTTGCDNCDRVWHSAASLVRSLERAAAGRA
jgi:hypothetical protein